MALLHQPDLSNTNQNSLKHKPKQLKQECQTPKHILWAEGQTWNERNGESSSACKGKRKKGLEGLNDGAQWNCTANLLPDLLLLWWFSGGPLLCKHIKGREKREIEQKERKLPLAKKRKQWAKKIEMLILKLLKPSDRKCGPSGKEGGLATSYRATNTHRLCRYTPI